MSPQSRLSPRLTDRVSTAPASARRPRGVIGCTKSVIRTSGSYLRESVTGEFYARVMVPWVTLHSTAVDGLWNKPAACRWLRSSSNNSADQGSIVTQSLSEKSALLRPSRSEPDDAPHCDGPEPGHRRRQQKFAGNLPAGQLSSGPLTELGLADVVDVDPDAADVALVDLDLVQIRGGMGVSAWRAPVVLPEVGAQAVL